MADATEWITLTTEDVYYALSASEVDVLANVQKQPGDYLADSQGQLVTTSGGQQFMLTPPALDLIAGYVRQVSLEMRGSIASGGYSLDESPMIPEMLKGHALALLVFKAWPRLGGAMMDLDEGRKVLYDRAIEILQLIERGRYDGLPKPESNDPQAKEVYTSSNTKLCL